MSYSEEVRNKIEERENNKRKERIKEVEFRDMLDKSHAIAELTGEIYKELPLLSGDGVKVMIEAIRKVSNKYYFVNKDKLRGKEDERDN